MYGILFRKEVLMDFTAIINDLIGRNLGIRESYSLL